MKQLVYILCLCLWCSYSAHTQSLSKQQAKLEALHVKSPDRCIKKSSKLLQKGKHRALAYYYLTCCNFQKYTQTNKNSYLSIALRSYGKFKKYNTKKDILVDEGLIRSISVANETRIEKLATKKRYSIAHKEAIKHAKLFDYNISTYDKIVDLYKASKFKPELKTHTKIKKNEVSTLITLNENKLIADADALIGTRYLFGGESSDGLDCSGFTRYVYQQSGINIPHSARLQSKIGELIGKEDCRVGDLIFFGSVSNNRYNFQHVGMIYSNENGQIKIIHCPNSGVRIEGEGEPSYDLYWQKRFLFIKRLNSSNLLTTKTD